jgi:hypothetical protein
MNDYQPPEERAFPASLLRKQKEYLMSEINKNEKTHSHRPQSRSQSLVLRFSTALAAVVLTVVCISIFGNSGPLQPLTMAQALEVITPVDGEVLHIKTSTDFMAEYYVPGESGPSGNSTDGTPRVAETWSRSDSTWAYREAVQGAGIKLQERAYYSTGLCLFYDGTTSSVLEVHDDTLFSGERNPANEGYLAMIRELLASGGAVEDGHEQIDGRDALRIVQKAAAEAGGMRGEIVYLVDAKTGVPIEVRNMNEGYTAHYDVYEKLPGTPENLKLLDLKAAHPNATVYTDWKAYDKVVGPGPGLVAD